MKKDITSVGFGPTSIIGYLSALAAAIPVVINAIEEGINSTAQGTDKYFALYTIITTAVTTLIRGLQASAKARAAGPGPDRR